MIASLLLFMQRLRHSAFARPVHCAGLVAIYFAVALVLISLSDHVFSEQVTIRYYAKMLAPVLSKMYDGRAPTIVPNGTRPLAKAQDLTTVFLVQDADLEQYDEPYPVRYKFWARRLATLAEYRPRAIFLDVFFIDKRNDPTLGGFVEQACSLRRDGIPVYIGSLAPRGLQTRPEIAGARTVLADGSNANCFTEVGIPKPTDKFDPSAWEYSLVQEPVANVRGVKGQARVTVAAQIYQDLGGKLDLHDAESMALIWGARPHPDNAILQASDNSAARKLTCDPDGLGWHKVVFNFFARMVSSNKMGKDNAAECFYHRTRPITQLREAPPAELDRMIEGRVVMLALDVAGLQDYVYSPVAEMPVPGVFLHAMALDNLMVFGQRYKQHAELEFFHNRAGWFAMLTLLVLCIATAVMDVYLPVLKGTLAGGKKKKVELVRRHSDASGGADGHKRRHPVAEHHEEAEESSLAGVENVTLANPMLMAIAVTDRVKSVFTSSQTSHEGTSESRPAALRREARYVFTAHLAIPIIKILVTASLSLMIFYVGYSRLDFGPLTWAEFVFFPILCHFLFVGPRVEKIFVDTEKALQLWLVKRERSRQ